MRKICGAVVLGLALLAGCVDEPLGPDAPRVSAAVQAGTSMDQLAKALAVALQQDSLRRQIFEDMRDSPFRKNGIHLASYLSGERGRSLREAIAAQVGRQPDGLLADVSSYTNLTIFVNPPGLRETWRGGLDLAVFPAHERAVVDGNIRGYVPGGAEITVSLDAKVAFAGILLGPSTVDFGTDPERQRASAPKQTRSTISAPGGPLGPMVGSAPLPVSFSPRSLGGIVRQFDLYQCQEDTGEGCDPCMINPQLPECQYEGPPPPPNPPGGSVFVPGTSACMWYMAPGPNADADELLDDCEYALALAMAPQTLVHWDDEDASREPYWAVKGDAQAVAVLYAFAYHKDNGPGSHNGDSEFVIVLAERTSWSGYWMPSYVFTAAHRGTIGDSSEWWAGNPAQASPWFPLYPERDVFRPLAPRVWVSKNKHGSYGSEAACDAGALWFDHCQMPVHISDVEVFPDANLGNQYYQLRNRVQSRSYPAYPRTECLWSDPHFFGWLTPNGSFPTSYGDILRDFGY